MVRKKMKYISTWLIMVACFLAQSIWAADPTSGNLRFHSDNSVVSDGVWFREYLLVADNPLELDQDPRIVNSFRRGAFDEQQRSLFSPAALCWIAQYTGSRAGYFNIHCEMMIGGQLISADGSIFTNIPPSKVGGGCTLWGAYNAPAGDYAVKVTMTAPDGSSDTRTKALRINESGRTVSSALGLDGAIQQGVIALGGDGSWFGATGGGHAVSGYVKAGESSTLSLTAKYPVWYEFAPMLVSRVRGAAKDAGDKFRWHQDGGAIEEVVANETLWEAGILLPDETLSWVYTRGSSTPGLADARFAYLDHLFVGRVVTVTFDSNGGGAVAPMKVVSHLSQDAREYESKSYDFLPESLAELESYGFTPDDGIIPYLGYLEECGRFPDAPTPPRSGMAFEGWYNAAGERITGESLVPANATDHVLTARWSGGQEAFAVAFNANGGYGSMTAQTFQRGEKKSLEANAFTRPNYTFDGWATSPRGSVVYVDGERIEPTADMTLYAHWTQEESADPTTGNLRFHSDNSVVSDGVWFRDRVLASDKPHELDQDPRIVNSFRRGTFDEQQMPLYPPAVCCIAQYTGSRAGYFNIHCEMMIGGQLIGADMSIFTNTPPPKVGGYCTLWGAYNAPAGDYAVKVTMTAPDGSSDTRTKALRINESGRTVSSALGLDGAIQQGVIALGGDGSWFGATGGGHAVSGYVKAGESSALSLTAKYPVWYEFAPMLLSSVSGAAKDAGDKFRWHQDGGAIEEVGANRKLSVFGILLPDETLSWVYTRGSSTPGLADMRFAYLDNLFVGRVVTVTFDSNGGGAVAPMKVVSHLSQDDREHESKSYDFLPELLAVLESYGFTLDDSVIPNFGYLEECGHFPDAPTPPRSGMAFEGWYNAAGERITGESLVPANATDHVLTARWSGGQETFAVAFNANGGYGSMTAQTFKQGEKKSLEANAFTRPNYTFDGWATSPRGSVVYVDGERIEPTADMTLYAHWTRKASADLQIKSATFCRTSVYIGEKFYGRLKVGNNGDAAADSFHIEIADGNSSYRKQISCGGVSAGAEQDCRFSISSLSLGVGSHVVTVKADYYNDIAESNESNNSKTIYLTVLDVPPSSSTVDWQFKAKSGNPAAVFLSNASSPKVATTTFKVGETICAQVNFWNALKNGTSGEVCAAILLDTGAHGYWYWDSGLRSGKVAYVSDSHRALPVLQNLPPGTYTLEVLLDSAHFLGGTYVWYEGSKLNNTTVIEFTVVADFCIVTFNANDGSVSPASRTVASGAAVGELPTPTRSGYTFDYWWTAASGGSRVSASTRVTANVTYYAHWIRNSTPSPTPKPDPTPAPDKDYWIYSGEIDGSAPGAAASEYNGYLFDDDGNMKGTIQAKVGKPNKKTGLATIKATVQLGAKKVTLKAVGKGSVQIAADGPTELELVGGEECVIVLGADGFAGSYGAYAIDGARNFFASKDKAELNAANAVLGNWLGGVSILADVGNFTVTISAKGKAKVSGTLANGKKATGNAVFLIGEEWACVPVVLPKANISFALWLPLDGGEVVVSGLGDDVVAGRGGALKAGAAFRIDEDEFAAVTGIAALPYLPDGVLVEPKGTKWVVAGGAKAGKVAYRRGTQEIDEAKLGENPSGLKLTYKKADGSFKGSFKAYADVKGKLKATTVSVSGIVLNGVGYGTATVKGKGSVPITIE